MQLTKMLFPIGFIFLLANSPGRKVMNNRAGNYDNDQIIFISRDSVKMYLNSVTGSLDGKACSDIYRVAGINRYFQFEGLVKDHYTSNDSIAITGTYVEGIKEGEFTYYYPNGNIKEKGVYKGNNRAGKWMYYFENGKIHKLIDFIDDKSFLVECYSDDGKVLTKDGNGKFEGNVSIGEPGNLIDVEVRGQVNDGLMSGKWEVKNKTSSSSNFMEYFNNGIFKEGISESLSGKKKYTDKYFSSFESTHSLDFLDYYTQAEFCFVGNSSWKSLCYNTEVIGIENYYPGLKQAISSTQNELKDAAFSGWAFIKNDINKDGRIGNISIELSSDATPFKEKLIKYLYKLDKWKPAERDRRKVDYYRFVIVLIEGNEVVIPEEVLLKDKSIFKPD